VSHIYGFATAFMLTHNRNHWVAVIVDQPGKCVEKKDNDDNDCHSSGHNEMKDDIESDDDGDSDDDEYDDKTFVMTDNALH
jgi:hypothetical protein